LGIDPKYRSTTTNNGGFAQRNRSGCPGGSAREKVATTNAGADLVGSEELIKRFKME